MAQFEEKFEFDEIFKNTDFLDKRSVKLVYEVGFNKGRIFQMDKDREKSVNMQIDSFVDTAKSLGLEET